MKLLFLATVFGIIFAEILKLATMHKTRRNYYFYMTFALVCVSVFTIINYSDRNNEIPLKDWVIFGFIFLSIIGISIYNNYIDTHYYPDLSEDTSPTKNYDYSREKRMVDNGDYYLIKLSGDLLFFIQIIATLLFSLGVVYKDNYDSIFRKYVYNYIYSENSFFGLKPIHWFMILILLHTIPQFMLLAMKDGILKDDLVGN